MGAGGREEPGVPQGDMSPALITIYFPWKKQTLERKNQHPGVPIRVLGLNHPGIALSPRESCLDPDSSPGGASREVEKEAEGPNELPLEVMLAVLVKGREGIRVCRLILRQPCSCVK